MAVGRTEEMSSLNREIDVLEERLNKLPELNDKLSLIEKFVEAHAHPACYAAVQRIMEAYLFDTNYSSLLKNSDDLLKQFYTIYSSLKTKLRHELSEAARLLFTERSYFLVIRDLYRENLRDALKHNPELKDQTFSIFQFNEITTMTQLEELFKKLRAEKALDTVDAIKLQALTQALNAFKFDTSYMRKHFEELAAFVEWNISKSASHLHALIAIESWTDEMNEFFEKGNFLTSRAIGGGITSNSVKILTGGENILHLSKEAKIARERFIKYLDTKRLLPYLLFEKAIPPAATFTSAQELSGEGKSKELITLNLLTLWDQLFQQHSDDDSTRPRNEAFTAKFRTAESFATMWAKLQEAVMVKDEKQYIQKFKKFYSEFVYDKAEIGKLIVNGEEDPGAVGIHLRYLIDAIPATKEGYQKRREFVKEVTQVTPPKLRKEIDLPNILLKYCVEDYESIVELYDFVNTIQLPQSSELQTLLLNAKILKDEKAFKVVKRISELRTAGSPILVDELARLFKPSARSKEKTSIEDLKAFNNFLQKLGAKTGLSDKGIEKLFNHKHKDALKTGTEITDIPEVKQLLQSITLPTKEFLQLVDYVTQSEIQFHDLLGDLALDPDTAEPVGPGGVIFRKSRKIDDLKNYLAFLGKFDTKKSLPSIEKLNKLKLSDEHVEDLADFYYLLRAAKHNKLPFNPLLPNTAQADTVKKEILCSISNMIVSTKPNEKLTKTDSKKLKVARALLNKAKVKFSTNDVPKSNEKSPRQQYEEATETIISYARTIKDPSHQKLFKNVYEEIKWKVSISAKIKYLNSVLRNDSSHGSIELSKEEIKMFETLLNILSKFKESKSEAESVKLEEDKTELQAKEVNKPTTDKLQKQAVKAETKDEERTLRRRLSVQQLSKWKTTRTFSWRNLSAIFTSQNAKPTQKPNDRLTSLPVYEGNVESKHKSLPAKETSVASKHASLPVFETQTVSKHASLNPKKIAKRKAARQRNKTVSFTGLKNLSPSLEEPELQTSVSVFEFKNSNNTPMPELPTETPLQQVKVVKKTVSKSASAPEDVLESTKEKENIQKNSPHRTFVQDESIKVDFLSGPIQENIEQVFVRSKAEFDQKDKRFPILYGSGRNRSVARSRDDVVKLRNERLCELEKRLETAQPISTQQMITRSNSEKIFKTMSEPETESIPPKNRAGRKSVSHTRSDPGSIMSYQLQKKVESLESEVLRGKEIVEHQKLKFKKLSDTRLPQSTSVIANLSLLRKKESLKTEEDNTKGPLDKTSELKK